MQMKMKTLKKVKKIVQNKYTKKKNDRLLFIIYHFYIFISTRLYPLKQKTVTPILRRVLLSGRSKAQIT